MLELLVVSLFVLGMAISIWSANCAIKKRTVISCVFSVLLPLLFALLLVALIGGHRLDIPATAFFGSIFLTVGWLQAWEFFKEQRSVMLAQLSDVEQHVIDDQSHIEEWQRIVTRLDRAGHDTKEAKAFLEGLQRSKAEYLCRWDLVRKELEQYRIRI